MPHSPVRRLRQLERVIVLIELISPLRNGATAAELARDIADELDGFCVRTIRRDLQTLELIGLVESDVETKSHNEAARWRWSRDGWRGRALLGVAEQRAAAAE